MTYRRRAALAAMMAGSFVLSGCIGGNKPEPTPTPTQVQTETPTPSPTADPPKREIRVNQVGYRPDQQKPALFFSDSVTPVDWKLIDRSSNQVVASGKSSPQHEDKTTGKKVHLIDFTSYKGVTKTLYLATDNNLISPDFETSYGIYQAVQPTTMNWFYTQRSGTAIDNYTLQGYGRPIGHKRDEQTPCPTANDPYQKLLSAQGQTPWTCSEAMNLSGGWYDSGNTSKYTVNGALATSILLRAVERATSINENSPAAKDGISNIPEAGNGRPDFLDEAMWELNWLKKAQITEGQYAGMSVHKMGNTDWGKIPQDPATDTAERVVYRPSTEATFYSAAVMAQAARIIAPYDSGYAGDLKVRAEAAYRAAIAFPDMKAPKNDPTIDPDPGTLDYAGADLKGAKYWAEVELYILTKGHQNYGPLVENNPLTTTNTFGDVAYTWDNVTNLAKLDLARWNVSTNPGMTASNSSGFVRQQILSAADKYLSAQFSSVWGLPYAPSDFKERSVQHMANNAAVLIAAYDVNQNERYRAGAQMTSNWILGMNGVGRSFVTGAGTDSVQNQVSVLYAHSVDPATPLTPPGTTVNGPNGDAAEQGDPVIKELAPGCVEQMCQVDSIKSNKTNENDVATQAAVAALFAFLNRN